MSGMAGVRGAEAVSARWRVTWAPGVEAVAIATIVLATAVGTYCYMGARLVLAGIDYPH